MKKILISIIIILLLILTYFALAKGIKFLNIKSINDIKLASTELNNDFSKASELTNKTYPSEVEELENAIKSLKMSKLEYENKNASANGENALGTIEIKNYRIHYLWTILGNYGKDRKLQSLNFSLSSTQAEDDYDLKFTLIGSYTNITDFIYDIENDEELNFEIKNFTISSQINNISQSSTTTENNTNNSNDNSENNSGSTAENNTENTDANTTNNNSSETVSQQNQTTTNSDGITLQAQFTVEDVGITLD